VFILEFAARCLLVLRRGICYAARMKMHNLTALVALVCTLLACQPAAHKELAPAAKPAPGDVLVISSLGDASNLIPMLASDSASHEVAGFIYNGLVKYDKDFRIVPDLAASWEVLDGGKRLRFHLRKDVRWHDGQPFTARDVMFTYKLMIDPKTPTAYADKYLLVKQAKQLDDYTVEFSYEKPFAPALISWGALQVLPEHLLKGKDVATSTLSRAPVGTGPYKFKSWVSGSRIVLVANDDYFAGRPHLNAISYRVIPDGGTQFMELMAGGIDMMGLEPLQYLRQTSTAAFKRNYTKYKYLADGYSYLGFNLKRQPFNDVRFRQAVACAIDKNEIIKGALMGLALPANGPYKPGTYWYNKAVTSGGYDPARAKALLKEMGYADTNADGLLEKNGQTLKFTIVTNQGNDIRSKTAQIIKERLKQVGIQVDIRVVEWTAFLKDFIDKGDFDAVILAWNILQDPDLFNVWHSSQTFKGGLNFVGYKNAEVDELLIKGRETYDDAARKRCYDRIQEILAVEQPYVFLYVPYALPAVSSRIKGIVPAPAGVTYNIEDWFVPAGQQKYQAIP